MSSNFLPWSAKPELAVEAPATQSLDKILRAFHEFGERTRVLATTVSCHRDEPISVPTFVNEFWTARQRAAHSLHEVSYRACFKPQLPRFFVERLTQPGEIVYDPFMGRGTTLIEAALLGRVPWGCDVNPLSRVLTRARLRPPMLDAVEERLREINLEDSARVPEELLTFYHPETLREISALRKYLLGREAANQTDALDDWITLVTLNRLTGHSPGFLSVYTLPPNQAVSIASQQKINARRRQTPPRRNLVQLLLKKTRALLADVTPGERARLAALAKKARLLTTDCRETPELKSNSVALVVTSPPFLNVVDYAGDNWLRCWFLGLDARSVKITAPGKLAVWQQAMTAVFLELRRLLRPGGHIAFEVGEVQHGTVLLEEAVLPCGLAAGLQPELVMINDQQFTKTANCWGVANNARGTNTNRIVLFRK